MLCLSGFVSYSIFGDYKNVIKTKDFEEGTIAQKLTIHGLFYVSCLSLFVLDAIFIIFLLSKISFEWIF